MAEETNVLMAVAAGLAAFCSIWSVWSKVKWLGIGALVAFAAAAVVVHFVRRSRPVSSDDSTPSG